MNHLLKKKVRFWFEGAERSGLVVLINGDTVSVDLDEMIRYRDGFATRVTVKPSDIISVD